MAFRSMIAEKKIEQQFIEQEGKFYMERIQEEKSKRNEGDDHHQITSS